ncbi:hypothetical protein GA0070606_3007 [Micromonospora citrea]|uniref:Uncharacterized protein n=1 Tax=Micromonospora citrea TaxID=47855 RepID=A0A1C6UYF5_9ACTN|nr:hypothetical protein [Micromonospora citrea]SCL58874.1 hypothetical protein GA0070606_3007 [Micromonospora citrea]
MRNKHERCRPERSGWLLAQWMTVLRRRLVPMVAVVAVAAGLLLAAPASAAAPDPNERPAAGPTPGPADAGDPMGRARRLLLQLGYEVSALGSPDPDDPNYQRKIIANQVMKRVQAWVEDGKTSFGWKDVYVAVQDAEEIYRKSQKSLERLKGKLKKSERKLRKLTEAARDTTLSPKQQAKAERNLKRARAKHAAARRAYLKTKAAIAGGEDDREIKDLKSQVRDLKRDLAKAKRKRALPVAQRRLEERLDAAQKKLDEARAAKADRDRRQDGDDSDSSGTTARPPKGPKGSPTGETKAGPDRSQSVGPGGPRPGRFRLWPRGTRTDSGAAELIGQGVAEEIRARGRVEDEKLLARAKEDPALRKRIIDDYREYPRRSPWEKTMRDFDTSKGFRQTEALRIGPELMTYQEAEDIANRSNSDPAYQQARRDCGGYDTCVKERTRKLREQNTKLKKQADRSNNDPAYQQARRECGGYDTCVKERTRKLREQNTKLKKQADRSNNDPAYQQARRDCGGYDTCVKERTRKLREQNTKLKKQADRSNNDPAYQQARRECGGYDTCVKERTRKLREQRAGVGDGRPDTRKTNGSRTTTKKTDAPAKTTSSDSKHRQAYEQANRECGGYDTCVKERTRKLREQNADAGDGGRTTKKATGSRTGKKTGSRK